MAPPPRPPRRPPRCSTAAAPQSLQKDATRTCCGRVLASAARPQPCGAVRADRAGAVGGVCEQLAAEERRAGLKEAVGAKAECEQVAASGHLFAARGVKRGCRHTVRRRPARASCASSSPVAAAAAATISSLSPSPPGVLRGSTRTWSKLLEWRHAWPVFFGGGRVGAAGES